jgi:hypothetical protein
MLLGGIELDMSEVALLVIGPTKPVGETVRESIDIHKKQ